MKRSLFASLLVLMLTAGVPSIALAGPGIGDSDNDTIDDLFDNCTNASNTAQQDVDGDGCGNACDADFDQSGGVVIADFLVLKDCFGQSVPGTGPAADPTCAESDLDSSGSVVIADFLVLKDLFGGPPGPSGNPLRDTTACP